MSLDRVKNIILILSGKGGVGKSSITTQLALSLSLAGHSVGVLDIDLTGPSIPRFFGIENEKIKQAPDGWIPVQVHQTQKLPPPTPSQTESRDGSESTDSEHVGSLHAMSLAFLLASRSTAIVWRGPKKTAMIRQFLSDVNWPAIDYLLIDTPPGTSDEHISVVETLLKKTIPSGATAGSVTGPRLAGAVLVTTPQAVATADVRKEINFCAKTAVPVIGVVENMSGYICPCCGVSTNLFSKGGGEVMAKEFGLRFLGGVPIDQQWGLLVEEGRRPVYKQEAQNEGQDEESDSVGGDVGDERALVETNKHADGLLVDKYRDCELYPIFKRIARQVTEVVEGNTAVLVDPHVVRTA